MPRQIKGWKFYGQEKDAFESYKLNKLVRGLYKDEDVKVLHMQNQFGQPYDVYYTREGAQPIRKLAAMFGSNMRFEDAIRKQRKHKRFMRSDRYENRGQYFYAGHRKSTDNRIQERIIKLLYMPNADAVDKEIITIEIPRSKKHHLEFLEAYTSIKTQGVWKNIHDDNLQIEIEFKDARNEKYGIELIKLFKELNRKVIKEKVLYVRTEPVEESSL
jgi:hypothetical protein